MQYPPQILVLLRKGDRTHLIVAEITRQRDKEKAREYCSPILGISAAIALGEFLQFRRPDSRLDERNDGCGNIIGDAHISLQSR